MYISESIKHTNIAYCCPDATADCTVADRIFNGNAAITTNAICQEALNPRTSEIARVKKTCAWRATELPNPMSTKRGSEASLAVSMPNIQNVSKIIKIIQK